MFEVSIETTPLKKYKIGMLLFPDVTILDFVSAYEVFVKAPCFEILVIAETTASIQAEGGLKLKAVLPLRIPLNWILFLFLAARELTHF